MTAAKIISGKKSGTIKIKADATISDAVGLLAQHNIGALIVSNDGKAVAGILSERDIIRGLQESGASFLGASVKNIMTSAVQTCAPSDTIRSILARMTERRVRHLPVLEDNRLLGIVSIGDVVKFRLDELVSEAEALKEYISHA
jgi:CBS domain-containing protein